MLGAGRAKAFASVTLPLLRPALAAASSLVFLFTFTSFGVILILGGPGLRTLEVEIYRRTTALLDLPLAAVLALVQMVAVIAVLAAYARYQERRSIEQSLRPIAEVARRPRSPREWALVTGVLSATGALLLGPAAVLVGRSLHGASGWGFDFYRALGKPGRTGALLVDPLQAVGNSAVFAGVATLVAMVVGLMAAAVIAYRRGRAGRWFDTLLMLPLGTSAVTIGFGFLVALDAPIDLRSAWVLVPLAHALVAVPFVVRTVVPVMRSVRTRLREAAAVLGAAPGRVWREIDLPMVSRAAAAGAGFAFAVSLGEFGATAFIARPRTMTMPLAIFRFLGQPGELNFGRAMAMSVVLMMVTVVAITLFDRYRPASLGEF